LRRHRLRLRGSDERGPTESRPRSRRDVDRLLAQFRAAPSGVTPVIGFERTPRAITDALHRAAANATASTLLVARLERADGVCGELLAELRRGAEQSDGDASAIATTVRHYVSRTLDPAEVMRLIAILGGLVHDAEDAGEWWCRATDCRLGMQGVGSALRDATRALEAAIGALDAAPSVRETALEGVEARVTEGHRLARRARAEALTGDDPGQALSRMAALAATDRALRACTAGARSVERLAAGRQ
jgi:hypothetical protein